MKFLLPVFCLVLSGLAAPAPNRFTVLDEFSDTYYPDAGYAKLITPQWIGEDGVEAGLVLAIDDMREPAKYEAYLRPILDRLKQIDGRAPVSIMTCKVDPGDAQLQRWLQEGISLEVHTIDHPCPILDKSDFAAAKSTYDRCVDLMASIPGNRPVAFRTPCMDGINSASPRLFTEIIGRTTPSGKFLTMSSSIGMVLTPDDPENPRELVTDKDGKPRFNKYLLPDYVNYIKNYPYPWVIGNAVWELGFSLPDDYQGSRVHGDKSDQTLSDMKASIDAVVAKKGLWVMTFHPYNWIDSKQVVALIDHVVAKHGKRAKFLNLREVQERIDQNLLAGQPLRSANGSDNGVRVLDLNADGHLDVVIGNDALQRTRLWNAKNSSWQESSFPGRFHNGEARFAVLRSDGQASVLLTQNKTNTLWHLTGSDWKATQGPDLSASFNAQDRGIRFRDLDGDGISELIVSNPQQNAIYSWNAADSSWKRAAFALPEGASIVTTNGQDNGLRFVDLNHDGSDDLILSNEKEFGLWLYVPRDFLGFKQGFTREVLRGRRGDKPELPMIVRGGESPNNGAFFTSDAMLVQNEDTGKLPALLERVSFKDLLGGLHAQAKSPKESLAQIEVLPGFEIELVANEPQVESPVYLDWSADGTMWVVEMRDYPKGINGRAGGVVKRLRDADGDGFYEDSKVFAENLNYPNGLFPWRDGLLISAAPDILYAVDMDGDGQADKTEVLFSGFVEGNQQHRANGYEWGLDGWLYGANGDSGGEILSKKTGRKVSISRRDFRFKPDTGEFEAISGNAQYGRRRDDWGNWFGGANYTWGWHYFLEEAYLNRNPSLNVRGTYKPYATSPDSGRVYTISRVQQRFNDIGMAGHVTSGCSFTPYRDSLFGPEFERSIFISEPVHNLVHREVLEPQSVSFISHRGSGEEKKEFLASRDPWFRPTTTKVGPDGALYICDMYRLIIEHPEWIPADVQERMNLRAGEGMGRIYRLRPTAKALEKISNLAVLKNSQLVKLLDSPNGWQRDTVQRLLFERNAKEVVDDLKQLLETSTNPKTRLQTLATIEILGGVTPPLLITELRSAYPKNRSLALRFSEPFLTSQTPEAGLFKEVIAKVADPDLLVRYQLAFTLGAVSGKSAETAAERLAQLAEMDGQHDAMITAVLSSSAQRPELVLKHVLEKNISSERLLAGLFKTASQNGSRDAIAAIVNHLLQKKSPEKTLPVIAAMVIGSSDSREFIVHQPEWKAFHKKAQQLALNSRTNEKLRLSAIALLGLDPADEKEDLVTLSELLGQGVGVGEPVQNAALTRLEKIPNSATAAHLMRKWSGTGPEIRSRILSSLLTRPIWTTELVRSLEAHQIRASELGPTVQQQLLTHRNKDIRERAAKVLNPPDSSRDRIVQEYLKVVEKLLGNAKKGEALFTQHCALCHKAGNLGTGNAPNLAMLYDRGPEQIITAILDPNRAVEDRYRNYIVELNDDEEVSGMLIAETGNNISISGLNGLVQTIDRRKIRSLNAQNRSLMPEGFEQYLQPQDVADLVTFIQNSAIPAP